MIVYRNYRQLISTNQSTVRIRALISKMESSDKVDYQDAVSFLIETGELETGISDHVCGDKDSINSEIKVYHDLTLMAASVVCTLWENRNLDKQNMAQAGLLLSKIESNESISSMTLSVPEGFVYYGLYPETYIEAAEKFRSELEPHEVVVIGLRSIGTTLSALVAAQLKMSKCGKVHSFTVRPRGHPFSRKLELREDLETENKGVIK